MEITGARAGRGWWCVFPGGLGRLFSSSLPSRAEAVEEPDASSGLSRQMGLPQFPSLSYSDSQTLTCAPQNSQAGASVRMQPAPRPLASWNMNVRKCFALGGKALLLCLRLSAPRSRPLSPQSATRVCRGDCPSRSLWKEQPSRPPRRLCCCCRRPGKHNSFASERIIGARSVTRKQAF